MAAVCIGAGCCSGAQGRSIPCSERDSSSNNKYALYNSKRLNGKVGSRRKPRFWCCNAAAAANNSDPRPDAFDLWKTAAGYHPLEELSSLEKEEMEKMRGGKLTDGETARTITEVNTNAILLAPALSHSNSVFGTAVTYLVDEHGEIYFELPDDSDVLQNLFVNPTCSFLIGFGDLNELLTSELLPAYENHLIAENEDETFEEDDFLVSEDDDSEEEEEDVSDSDDSDDSQAPNDVHPIVFASKLAKVAASDVMQNIYRPSLRLAMTGVVRSVSEEEEPYVRKKWEDRYFWENDGSSEEDEDEEEQNDDEEKEGDTKAAAEDASDSSSESEDWTDSSETETSFYKFEINSIQITSDLGAHASVDVKEFGYSEPDVLAHAAPEIMKRLNSGGKKIKRALKTLCHREKGLNIEEATIIGVDSLGMDVRASCGLELRTIRVPFIRRARCADTAQLLLHQLLYPRSRHKK